LISHSTGKEERSLQNWRLSAMFFFCTILKDDSFSGPLLPFPFQRLVMISQSRCLCKKGVLKETNWESWNY
jgi:hypothetical protein